MVGLFLCYAEKESHKHESQVGFPAKIPFRNCESIYYANLRRIWKRIVTEVLDSIEYFL